MISPEDNLCPACGPVVNARGSFYCQKHARELRLRWAAMRSDWLAATHLHRQATEQPVVG